MFTRKEIMNEVRGNTVGVRTNSKRKGCVPLSMTKISWEKPLFSNEFTVWELQNDSSNSYRVRVSPTVVRRRRYA